MERDAIPAKLPSAVRARIEIGENGCWVWTGRRDPDGYGRWKHGREQLAHRAVYSVLVGDLGPSVPLDHLCCSPAICAGGTSCQHRRCVNPDHLTPTTTRANLLRSNSLAARNAAKTACERGHEFTAANTYIRATGRSCRACHRESSRQYRARQAAAR